MLATIPVPFSPLDDLIVVLGYWMTLLLLICVPAYLYVLVSEWAERRRRRQPRGQMIDLTAVRHTRAWDWPTRTTSLHAGVEHGPDDVPPRTDRTFARSDHHRDRSPGVQHPRKDAA